MISSSKAREALVHFWPYAVAAAMMGYVLILLAVVADDISVTSRIVGS